MLRYFVPQGQKTSGRWDSNPRRPAWEADILPLNYARHFFNAECKMKNCLSLHLAFCIDLSSVIISNTHDIIAEWC